MNNDEQLAEGGLPLIDKLRLLAEWAPLIGRLQMIATAATPQERALAIVKTLQWAAGKTGTEVDDEALEHLEALLNSAEGRAFFDWVVKKLSEVGQ